MTTDARERETRAKLEAIIGTDGWALEDPGHNEVADEVLYALDAYREAIRAARDAELRAVVEGMRDEVPVCCGPDESCAYDTIFDASREAYDTVLSALAHDASGRTAG